jgi:hypothetical protein
VRCEHAFDDAAYVLGSLSPDERRDYVSHLQICAECRANVREFAGLPGLLARVETDGNGRLGDELNEPPPPTLLPRLLAAAQAERFRARRRVVILAAAACLAVLAAIAVPLTLLNTLGGDVTPTPKQTPIAMQSMQPLRGASSVSAAVGLVDEPWGTKVVLECSYAPSRYDTQQAYALWAVSRSHMQEQIGSWTVGPGEEITTDAATKFRHADLEWLEIRRSDNSVVLRLRV